MLYSVSKLPVLCISEMCFCYSVLLLLSLVNSSKRRRKKKQDYDNSRFSFTVELVVFPALQGMLYLSLLLNTVFLQQAWLADCLLVGLFPQTLRLHLHARQYL